MYGDTSSSLHHSVQLRDVVDRGRKNIGQHGIEGEETQRAVQTVRKSERGLAFTDRLKLSDTLPQSLHSSPCHCPCCCSTDVAHHATGSPLLPCSPPPTSACRPLLLGPQCGGGLMLKRTAEPRGGENEC
jgi:hypothetical protein